MRNRRLIVLGALTAALPLFATAGEAAEDHSQDKAYVLAAMNKMDMAYNVEDAAGYVAYTAPNFVFTDLTDKEKTHGKAERQRKLTAAFAKAADLAVKMATHSTARDITFDKDGATVVEDSDTSFKAAVDDQVRLLNDHAVSRDLWVKSPAGWLERSREMTSETFTLGRGAQTVRAVLLFSPPVYDPGGPVCFIEDWQDDEPLLAEAEEAAAAKGAVLARVVCPHSDEKRAATLSHREYAIASEWYTAALPLPKQASGQAIRPLTAADVPRLLELGEEKRRQYAAYSLVFWRMSSQPRETFGPYLQSQIENPDVVALGHEQNGTLNGFVLANARGYIDDFMVAAPELWPTVGAELLKTAGAVAYKKGTSSLLVVCAAGDKPLRTMLAAESLAHATDWYVRPLGKQQDAKRANNPVALLNEGAQ